MTSQWRRRVPLPKRIVPRLKPSTTIAPVLLHLTTEQAAAQHTETQEAVGP
jgi:hypothetical protein